MQWNSWCAVTRCARVFISDISGALPLIPRPIVALLDEPKTQGEFLGLRFMHVRVEMSVLSFQRLRIGGFVRRLFSMLCVLSCCLRSTIVAVVSLCLRICVCSVSLISGTVVTCTVLLPSRRSSSFHFFFCFFSSGGRDERRGVRGIYI